MALSLVIGPARAGKVALLLDRFLESIARDPWLIVPNRSDVDRVERDLLTRSPILFAGRIGTFDDVFDEIAAGHAAARPVAPPVVRELAVRRAVSGSELGKLAPSAGTTGFADSLLRVLAELDAALVDQAQLEGDLARLRGAYHAELERLGLCDRQGLRALAVERLSSALDAWRPDRPVYAYGFEDLTAAEWSLLEALAGRADVTVSIPYEPGRIAFASLGRTVGDLAQLAGGRIEELSPNRNGALPGPLHHLERRLFEDAASGVPAVDGSIRFLEGGGTRGTLELVAEEVVSLIRAGTPPEAIAIVCDSIDRWRAPLDATFAAFGIPFAVEERLRLTQSAFGAALVSLLRFAWLAGERGDLFSFLRSPFSGLQRRSVDFVEGRLRGRAVRAGDRVEEEGEKLRGAPVAQLAALHDAPTAAQGALALCRWMASAAFGLDSPPTGDIARTDLAAFEAATRLLDELVSFEIAHGPVTAEDVVASLERATARPVGAGEPGRVAVLDLLRARTRDFDALFLLGLEEGSLPRRGRVSPFLDDDRRAALGCRLERADPVSRDRYLFYTACTRARERLTLVREASTDDGQPREPSPFWDEVVRLYSQDDVTRWTRRRPLSALSWPIDAAPTERERLRALSLVAVDDEPGAAGLASANGWGRRLDRALGAFSRRTRLRHPATLSWLSARSAFSVTELETFADCSQRWFVERQIDPKAVDAEPDALLRGQIAHQALHRFYSGLSRELGGPERVSEDTLERALPFLARCLDEAIESWLRFDATDLQRAELRESLLRDLEGFVSDEAGSALELVPRRFEVSFGMERAAPELQRGLPLGDGIFLSGKIDRIDQDPFGARGIVQDYKSGRSAHSAAEIDRELRLQVPLYMLVLRDLVGVEPLGGVYRALSGKRPTRGMLRESAKDDLPGFAANDYLPEDAFWSQVEVARTRALESAERIRAGDVLHDPRGGECPSWCDAWPVCRVERA
jgi:ATP-dependent helicase/DNAse subunit B